MTKASRLSEIDIRLQVLEYVAKIYADTDFFAAIEARYSANLRRADILVVTDRSHAYEIKSDFDRLDRLEEQLLDYRRTFDFVTVVTTRLHASQARRMLGKNDGLIVISNKGLKEIKAPKRNKRIEKKQMISMCSKMALVDALNATYSNVPVEKVRTMAYRKLSLPELRQATFQELKRRFKNRYDAFAKEACVPYREGDLCMLKQNNKLATSLILS